MSAPPLTPTPLSQSDTLLTALFVAAIIHVAVLLGVNFTAPHPPKADKSIEITVSHAPAKQAPKEAKYLAADHQIGAGRETRKPATIPQTLPRAEQTESQPRPKAAPVPAAPSPKPVVQKVLTQAQAPVKVESRPEQPVEPEQVAEPLEDKPKLSAEALQQQIAQLGERIRASQLSAENTKIKSVNAISTHKYLAAQYVKDWEDKVERTGNLNYPEAARKAGSQQMLTMDVGINADGSIYSMRIVRSSGNPALDDAAKRIVKMSAPFAELPEELMREVNVLVITRVWKFSDETGMTAR
ncbi:MULTISPECIES: energy transducer TonB [Methylomonas]|uniref:Energy transducer TonB n=1 Tax=Methylomonas koyamae TaxID=702114 RepID=A0A177PBE8_9GAMM|nr:MULTISPECIES: TonB family protein [Methylomonas]NJA06045.1 TonB family protein [Methylococcaceae bacterium WWC4]OAI26793.1 energy transducer TonB [Methylomonas koyamae]OHX36016.1 energy transducer TonB [Methylomonas sp. LWB]